MQAVRQGPSQPPVKIYNAVYSSVQVYECMIRGIAVMRRRGDSYVNATQILKVAGVDKGRRTKILEKEILPGKHEIVQGGYGKYQGTWIPLERGRDIALQYGVAPLLSPLFDFTPSTNSLSALPVSAPNITASPRPLSASSSYGSIGGTGGSGNYMGSLPSHLAPPPIMPGSALRLLNQGRAQGLFTPSTSSIALAASRQALHSPAGTAYLNSFNPPSNTPPPSQPLKRHRSEADADPSSASRIDIHMADSSRPPSAGPPANGANMDDGPSPHKRARMESSPVNGIPPSRPPTGGPGGASKDKQSPPVDPDRAPRIATKPSVPRNLDPTIPLKDTRRAAVIAAICQGDEPQPILNLLREIASLPNQSHIANPQSVNPHVPVVTDIDTILDDQGHTALHIAASLSRLNTVTTLISLGADVHRGNHLGETPLVRTILSTHSFDAQSLPALLSTGLSRSIMTLDTSRKSVLHHIVQLAGVKGRNIMAKYYLDQIFTWIAKEDGGDFIRIVDLQDEHGDTALNVAARVGSRTLVRTLVDIGANKGVVNKLGLRASDFGIETEELTGGPKGEEILAMLRATPALPVQKSQDVIADMTTMIHSLSSDFQSEVKSKQDNLDVTQAHLRAATRELSEQRKQIMTWQTRCAELDMLNQRARNVEKAIDLEDQFDWTGRYPRKGSFPPAVPDVVMKSPPRGPEGQEDPAAPNFTTTAATPINSPAFKYRGGKYTIIGMATPPVAPIPALAFDPEVPTANDLVALIRLRRMQLWQSRMEELMTERLKGLQGASAAQEYMCRKIVSLCTGVPVDKVESMLGNLVVAVESESPVVEIGRVSGFMQKVRDGII